MCRNRELGVVCDVQGMEGITFDTVGEVRMCKLAFSNSLQPGDGASCVSVVEGPVTDHQDSLIEPCCRDLVIELMLLDAQKGCPPLENVFG